MILATVEITDKPILPELVINKAKTDSSGCVLAYVGVIRDYSHGKPVLSVEYKDTEGTGEKGLRKIVDEVSQKWQLNNLAICHRIGKLKVGDINVVIAIAAVHRQEAFAACQYAIDRFKQIMPTQKEEAYSDGSVQMGWEQKD
jgi:molybdopterin synthase catalytic subunit